jgi:hypothetical protein
MPSLASHQCAAHCSLEDPRALGSQVDCLWCLRGWGNHGAALPCGPPTHTPWENREAPPHHLRLIPLRAYQRSLLFVFLITAVLTGVTWNLIVVLISIFLVVEVNHIFRYLLAICTAYPKKCGSTACLLIGLFA